MQKVCTIRQVVQCLFSATRILSMFVLTSVADASTFDASELRSLVCTMPSVVVTCPWSIATSMAPVLRALAWERALQEWRLHGVVKIEVNQCLHTHMSQKCESSYEKAFFENCINHSDSGWVTAFTRRVWADPEDYTSAASFAQNLCVPVYFAKKRTLPLAAAAPLITMVTTKADPNAEKICRYILKSLFWKQISEFHCGFSLVQGFGILHTFLFVLHGKEMKGALGCLWSGWICNGICEHWRHWMYSSLTQLHSSITVHFAVLRSCSDTLALLDRHPQEAPALSHPRQTRQHDRRQPFCMWRVKRP